MFTMFTRLHTNLDLNPLVDVVDQKPDPVAEILDEYSARSNRQLDWNESDEPQRRHSVFDEPRKPEKKPPPLPCITFPRWKVLLYNLRTLGYDFSQIAANDNDQARLSTALEVALCQKRGLLQAEEIAAALGLSVDDVRAAANDLHAASKAR